MNRKLTISIDAAVYDGLLATVGRGRISSFLESLARPLVVPGHLDSVYAEMAMDAGREADAAEWTEGLVADPHVAW
ncbi:hypothetical protein Pan44_18990 [Caulifigura coniformis]|uniref:Addiction module antitoxin n=1 Tax=Caulifigura coniformis TaxID=2527983 RepID=A0A517SCN0_9PLAN|nr:addiction module antitoxin [Caulifigura coniformis]QDT53873.1 hypothetical protein Pan44_18990 [Caulifigura coniformis]